MSIWAGSDMRGVRVGLCVAGWTLLAATVTACGGGGSGPGKASDSGAATETASKSAATVTVSGQAVDGYLLNAKVCLDIDGDFGCDGDEPAAWTDAKGRFSISAPAGEADAPVLVYAEAGTTSDSDLTGPVADDFVMVAPAGTTGGTGDREVQINPLLSLVAMVARESGVSSDDAAAEVIEAMGLADAVADSGRTPLELIDRDLVAAAADDADALAPLLRAAAPIAASAFAAAYSAALDEVGADTLSHHVVSAVLSSLAGDEGVMEQVGSQAVSYAATVDSPDGALAVRRAGQRLGAESGTREAQQVASEARARADEALRGAPARPVFRAWLSDARVEADGQARLSWVKYWGVSGDQWRIVEASGDERGAVVCSGKPEIDAAAPNGKQEGDCTIDAPAGDTDYQVGLARDGEWAWSDARHGLVVAADAPSTATGGNGASVAPVAPAFDRWQPGLDAAGRIEADTFTLQWSKWSGALAAKWRLLRDGEPVTAECANAGTVSDGYASAATPAATWDLWVGGRVVGKAGGQKGACTLAAATAGNGGVGVYEVELCNDGGCSRSEAFAVLAADHGGAGTQGPNAGKGESGEGDADPEPVGTGSADAPPAPSIAWLSPQQTAGVPFDVQWNIWWTAPARAAERWTLRVADLADAESSVEYPGCVDLPVELDGNRQSAGCPVTLADEGVYALSVEVCRDGGGACAASESVTVSTRSDVAAGSTGGDSADDGGGDSGGDTGGETGGDAGDSGPTEAGAGLGGLLAYEDPRKHAACIPAFGEAQDYRITEACIASLRADDRFGGACYADGQGDPASDVCDNAPDHGRDVIAYAIEWGVYGRDYAMWDLPAPRLTHINYSFLRIGREYSGSGGSAKLRENRDDNGVYVADPWASLQNTWSIADNWDLSELDRAGNLHYLRLLKAKFPHLKVLATIGGWTQSSEFYAVANDADARAEFVNAAVAFVERHGLNGIDIDWEFPGLGVGGDGRNRFTGANTEARDDTRNFTLLMEDLRAGLDDLASRTGHEYELATAVSANPKGIARIEYDRLVDVLDAINIMTYDFHGGWDQKTGHQTALYNAGDWTDHRFNVASAVAGILAQVEDEQDRANLKGKLNIGIATYGRGMRAANAGIGSARTGSGGLGSWESGIVDYHDMIPLDADGNVIQFREAGHEQEDAIAFQARVAAYKFCSKVRKEGCGDAPPTLQRLYDERADAAYLYDGQSGEFQTWDDLESVARKAAYVAGEELGGVIIWESTGDRKTTTAPDGEIVTVLDEYLGCAAEKDGDRNADHRNGADTLAVAADNGISRTVDEWGNTLQNVSRTSNTWYDISALAAGDTSPYTRWRCQ